MLLTNKSIEDEKMKLLETTFDHKTKEAEIWKSWSERKLFQASNESDKKPYVVLIPPPNVTDRLHMGHGLNNTIQDILVRWKRMLGFDCLWLPGTDHAGIATSDDESSASRGPSKETLGREVFKCQD